MKLKEKIKAYVVNLIREETQELENKENLLEENVENLNAAIELQETIAENVRNLNAITESYSKLEENVRNLNAAMESQEALAENVRKLNVVMADYNGLVENVRNLNVAIEVQETIAENVRNLNAAMEGYNGLAENVRSLNTAMESYSGLAENVRNLNAAMEGRSGLAENVRNLNAAMEGYDRLAENVRNLNVAMEGYNGLAENVRNLNVAMESYNGLAENVRNLNVAMEGYNGLAENVRNLNVAMEVQDTLAENVRNINSELQNYENAIKNIEKSSSVIETIHSTLEMQKVKIAMLEKARNTQYRCQPASEKVMVEAEQDGSKLEENVYSGIDYFDFENYFRGSMELIKRNQKQYVKYFKGKSNVVDLGCGRGEFLELLNENDINAKGVDLYEEFVEMCRMKELDVICDDALHFLRMQDKVGGIFAGQLIEHLTVNQLVELCGLAYEKLEEDAYIIMETPNPTCLAIYSHAFYIDPSHNKPVHPLTVKYILEKSGFTDIEIIYTDTSRLPIEIPDIGGIEGADRFNNSMHMVSEVLFGSQDYAVVAKKCDNRLKNC